MAWQLYISLTVNEPRMKIEKGKLKREKRDIKKRVEENMILKQGIPK